MLKYTRYCLFNLTPGRGKYSSSEVGGVMGGQGDTTVIG